jgi:hypothetical protein
VKSHEYIAIALTSLTEIILLNASDQLPPTFSVRFEDFIELTIYIATNIARNSKNEEDKINNSKPESVNDSDNLIAISDPKIAPNEPPAIIKPYSFLDLLSLNKLITNTQNIETTKKAYI